MNAFSCDTRPPLHIGASRIVDFPSGTSSAEFLIANSRKRILFIKIRASRSGLKKRLFAGS